MQPFSLDSSGIVHVAAILPHHSNTFRVQAILSEAVRPAELQQALNRITPRFPTIIAGIKPAAREFMVHPVDRPPTVAEEPDVYRCLTVEEITACGVRIAYRDRCISIDVFHSLTDGYGALTLLITLVAEYLNVAFGIKTPYGARVLDPAAEPTEWELSDDFVRHAGTRTAPANNAKVYQLPGAPRPQDGIRSTQVDYPTAPLLAAARAHDVSVTVLLSTIMLEAVAIVERRHESARKLQPLQIAVPADIRRTFESTTLRNFTLLGYPRIEPDQFDLPFEDRLKLVNEQLKKEFSKDNMEALLATYTKTQNNPLFRMLPLPLKRRIVKLVHHVFGSQSSCISLSNLGVFTVPDTLASHVESVRISLAPRIQSPYNLGMISFAGTCRMTFTRFCEEDELIECFVQCLEEHVPEVTA